MVMKDLGKQGLIAAGRVCPRADSCLSGIASLAETSISVPVTCESLHLEGGAAAAVTLGLKSPSRGASGPTSDAGEEG